MAYTVYMFYRRGSLYAYTMTKEFRDRFIQERNKEKFVEVKKKVNESSLPLLFTTYPHQKLNEIPLNNYKKLDEEKEEEIKINKVTDSKVFKIISSFEIIKNLSILNQKEEPLSNQNKLKAFGSLKLIVLFYIMLGENTFIILKYTENKMPFSRFLKKKFFFLIKLGMNSYESYKVLCGAVFGFKFISFYYKHEKDTKCKKTALFLTKIIPYIIIFCIVHFFLN